MTDWNLGAELLDLIRDKLIDKPSFRLALTKNIKPQIFENLKERIHGKKNDHVVLFITGVPGITKTGSFKSSISMEIASMLDPEFSEKNICFTNDELLDVIQARQVIYPSGKEKPTFWIRDESGATLKRRAGIEFSVLAESLRESKVSLIVVKPVGEPIDMAHYVIQPFLHSKDMCLVRCAIYNSETAKYRGYMDISIQLNNKTWKKYMIKKKAYQAKVIKRQTEQFNSPKYAKEIISKHKHTLYTKTTKKGDLVLIQKTLMRYISQDFPSLTNLEREYILDAVREELTNDGTL